MNTTTCPDTPDLLDHIEGKADLSAHVVACEPCSTALGELRAALDVDAALVATTPLETERALASVLARARGKREGRWYVTAIFSGAAAVTLALLLPASVGAPNAGAGPQGGGDPNMGVSTKLPVDVNAPNIPLDQKTKDAILGPCSATSTAPVHS